jgi:hypothetical protein
MMAQLRFFLTAFLLSACQSAEARSIHFMSAKGFSLEYPAEWTRYGSTNGIGPSNIRLEINSSADLVSGVGIKSGQADITVEKIDNPQQNTLVTEIRDSNVTDERKLGSNPTRKFRSKTCQSLSEIITNVEVGPNTDIIYHRYLCNANHGTFILTLRYWPGDKRIARWENVATRILESIKFQRTT